MDFAQLATIVGLAINTFGLVYGLGRASKTLERVDKSLEELSKRVLEIGEEVAFLKGKDAARS